MLIDTHCHILSSEYDNTEEVILNTFQKGVNKIIINGYNLESSKEAVLLAEKYENVYAAVGIGPQNIDDINRDTFDKISRLCKSKKVIAIGEIGLDYYWTKENKNDQIYVFENMLKIAKLNNLPVIIHSRNAINDVYNMVKRFGVTGILHCYSGSLESAKEFIKLGFLIGIGGVLTFKNSKEIKNIVKNISLKNISLETDSPYLSPEPLRGTKNEPSNIIYIAAELARLKDVSIETVIDETSNAVLSKFDL